MSFVLAGEIRSEEEVNKDDFNIGEVLSEEEKERREQEKFLSEIENSLQVSPEWHLKKKLTSCLMPKVAYEFLKSAYRYERDGVTFKIFFDTKKAKNIIIVKIPCYGDFVKKTMLTKQN